jgi:hypothetical protein
MRLILAAMFLLVPIASVFAYIDPGTGSMIIQVVIGSLVAAGAFIGAFWRRIFHRKRADADPEADPEADKD